MRRFEHGVAFVGEQLLVFGGFDPIYNCLAEVSRVLQIATAANVKKVEALDCNSFNHNMCKGGGLEPRDRDMEACCRYGAGNWPGRVWISCRPFQFNHMQQRFNMINVNYVFFFQFRKIVNSAFGEFKPYLHIPVRHL